MEPSADAVAAVQANLEGSQPISQPNIPQQPAYQQPVAPTSQPAPTSQAASQAPQQQAAPVAQPQDPFSTLFQEQPQPQQPTVPTPTPQPTQQPVEPSQPALQEPIAPVVPDPSEPTAPVEPQYQTFDEYMKEVTGSVGEEAPLPDASQIDPTDEAGIKTFFDDLVNTAVQRASQKIGRDQAIQTSERNLWDSAMDKYGSLKTNKNLRDMVHAIRMGEFQKGVAITPTQAADRLLDALKSQYQKGVADNQVVTTIENVQPTGGGGQTIQTTADMDNVLESVQTGGETALAAYLDTQVKAGNI